MSTCRPGVTCCAPSPGCRRCLRVSSLSPSDARPALMSDSAQSHAAPGDPEPVATTEAAPDEAPPIQMLAAPVDGVPAVTADPAALQEVAQALAGGTGPVAVDAERASGYRYGQRAYLVQLRRHGAGSYLIDPVALPDLSSLGAALEGVEWVLHAATQDIPCLAEIGMRPSALFDTELGARLSGRPKLG